MKVVNCLKIIGSNPITYDKTLLPRNWALLSDNLVKYIRMFFKRHINTGMRRNDMIEIITDIFQESYYVQVDNNLG